MKKLLLSLLLLASPAMAQSSADNSVIGFYLAPGQTSGSFTCKANNIGPCFVPYGSTIAVSGTFSASLAGFHPTAGATANLTVTTSSSFVALPAGTDIVVTNTGAADVSFRLTTGSAASLVTDQVLKSGAATGLHLSGETFIDAITATGSSSLNIQGGSGLASGYGGGGGSGGGGGVVTNAGTFAVQNTAATVAGTNIIGKISQVDSSGADATDTTNHAVKVNIVAGASSGAVAQGSTTSGQTGGLTQAAVTTSAPTYTTGQTNPLSLDTTGSLRVNVTSATGVAQNSTTSGQTISPVGGAVTTSAPTYTNAQTSLLSLDTSGGLRVNCTTGCSAVSNATKFTLTAAASTNATNVKGSAGSLTHVGVYNNSATLAWVSFYNTAGTPTCGTSIVYQTMIPANSTSGAGAVEDFASGLDFSTGIGICVTTGIAGTGSVAASSYVVNLGYK